MATVTATASLAALQAALAERFPSAAPQASYVAPEMVSAGVAAVDTLTGEVLGRHEKLNIYPAKHFVVEEQTLEKAVIDIEAELEVRHRELMAVGALVEAQRLQSRTKYDIEMLKEVDERVKKELSPGLYHE